MKIVLLSPIFPNDLGISTISSLLKSHGHLVNSLFVPQLLQDCLKPLPDRMVGNIIEFASEADFIGINCVSENYHKTAIFIDTIKKAIKAPVVWGGIHATLKPEDCIKHADIVCVGEGEGAMLELAEKIKNGERLEHIKNLLFRSDDNRIKQAELRPLVNLDTLLPLDYDLNTQYITRRDGDVCNIRESDYKGTFFAFSSRGCPFRCSYCCNSVMLDMYRGANFCRQRSIEKIINDLKALKDRFSSCKRIWFNEADFLSGKDLVRIRDFSKRYKEEIDISFGIWSNPSAVTEDNIAMLKYAGLCAINIGTINGSSKIQKQIYNRNAISDLYVSKSQILSAHKIDTEYDVILCNPYENDKDLLDTANLLMRLDKPYRILIYSLTFFPGTQLYAQVLRSGKIEEGGEVGSYREAVYKVFKFQGESAYLNIVLSLTRGKARRVKFIGFVCYGVLPEFVLKLLLNPVFIKFGKRLPLRLFICSGIIAMISFARKIILFARSRFFIAAN